MIGIVGLGTMGAGIRERLKRGGVHALGYDINPEVSDFDSLADMVTALPEGNRVVWVMVASNLTEQVINELTGLLKRGDVIIDGGNTHYVHDIRRAKELAEFGIQHMDVGTSGGQWGLERGYCLMVGGERAVFDYVERVFRALAPGVEAAVRTPGRVGEFRPEEQGYLLCGGHGAGHAVKMVHNAIEYGMMAAFAEGFNLLTRFDSGSDPERSKLMVDPELYKLDIDITEVAELWRRGSVVGSWLLDLTAESLFEEPDSEPFERQVSDSGEGRWAADAAIDTGTPFGVILASLVGRFLSQGSGMGADVIQNRQRKGFGGHKR